MMIFYNFLLDDEIKETNLWLMLYDVIEDEKKLSIWE
jgi:hypothetical protein